MKSITFLFWNIFNKENLTDRIIRIVNYYNVDIIILTECKIKESEILLKLNEKKTLFFFNNSRIPKHKIKIFSKFNDKYFHPVLETRNKRLTIRKLKLPATNEILVAALHLISKCEFERSQNFEVIPYAQELINAENVTGHKNSIIVGDFNMNPFEDGMIAGNGFNSVMSRKIAESEKRTIQGKEYIYFYNPMWNFFGDIEEPLGTYYYNRNEHINFYWNIFDQVLIRPSLINMFDLKRFKILDKDGMFSLLNNQGLPDKKSGSDHLPILFSLNVQQ